MSKFVIYEDDSVDTKQCWRWRLLDTNGRNIARSGEAFLKKNILDSIKKTRAKVTPSTPIVADGSKAEKGADCRFMYFKSDGNDKWGWKLQAAGNNKTMAIGGEGFGSQGDVEQSIKNVRDEMQKAIITWDPEKADPAYDSKESSDKDRRTRTKKGIPGS